MIKITHKGDFSKMNKFLSSVQKLQMKDVLDRGGQRIVASLTAVTPKLTGLTSSKWGYGVKVNSKGAILTIYNSNQIGKTNVAILIQYGHLTRSGSYVIGRDFINPILELHIPQIIEDVWKEVSNI